MYIYMYDLAGGALKVILISWPQLPTYRLGLIEHVIPPRIAAAMLGQHTSRLKLGLVWVLGFSGI